LDTFWPDAAKIQEQFLQHKEGRMRRLAGMAVLAMAWGAAVRAEEAKKPDLEAENAAIRAADVELDKVTAAKDKAKFLALLAPDVVTFPDKPAIGSDTMAQGWSKFFEPGDGPTLRWQPDVAEVFPSGDLGYTTGHWEFKGKDKEGKPRVGHGHYLTVWRKGQDGKWRMAVDIGTGPEPEPGKP
jgi:ketosteroid isomerase-like protein